MVRTSAEMSFLIGIGTACLGFLIGMAPRIARLSGWVFAITVCVGVVHGWVSCRGERPIHSRRPAPSQPEPTEPPELAQAGGSA